MPWTGGVPEELVKKLEAKNLAVCIYRRDPDFCSPRERSVARHQQTRGRRRCAEKPVGGRLGRLGERRLSRRPQQVLQLLYELPHVLCVFFHDFRGEPALVEVLVQGAGYGEEPAQFRVSGLVAEALDEFKQVAVGP
jgi:hypothetical protein